MDDGDGDAEDDDGGDADDEGGDDGPEGVVLRTTDVRVERQTAAVAAGTHHQSGVVGRDCRSGREGEDVVRLLFRAGRSVVWL